MLTEASLPGKGSRADSSLGPCDQSQQTLLLEAQFTVHPWPWLTARQDAPASAPLLRCAPCTHPASVICLPLAALGRLGPCLAVFKSYSTSRERRLSLPRLDLQTNVEYTQDSGGQRQGAESLWALKDIGGVHCALGLEGISISPATPEQLDLGK